MGKIKSSVPLSLLFILVYYLKNFKFSTDYDELLAPGADRFYCPVLGTSTQLWETLILL